ncbi:vestigial-like family member 2b [Silurus meridionalis]|nr:vestigial-like family member 2b [Silurus meridionalis]
MSCPDVMRPLYGHYAPHAPGAAAFLSNFPTPTRVSSPASRHRNLMDASGSEEVPVIGGNLVTGSLSSSAYSSAGQKEKQVGEAEYLSSRCVLFTYYQGDISSVVDEHFSRALSTCTAMESKRRANQPSTEPTSPNSRRNFPPSFWDSNYLSPPSRPHCDPTGTPAYSVDPYAQALHAGLPHPHPHAHPSDSWGYTQSQVYGPPRSLHELYSAPGLEAHYNPLLMPAVRPPHLPPSLPGHYDVAKLEPTPTWPGLIPPGDMALALNMDPASMETRVFLYPYCLVFCAPCPLCAPGLQSHKKGKELYWF